MAGASSARLWTLLMPTELPRLAGFYEERVFEGSFDLLDDVFGVEAPLGAVEGYVRGLREAGGGEELLHDVLVHASGGAEYAGAYVRRCRPGSRRP